jgi:hypothetical protein
MTDEFSWIVYKKATRDFKEFVLTLAVPYDSKVEIGVESHGGMARVSDVVVLKAETLSSQPAEKDTFYSLYDWGFQYKIGEKITSDMDSSKGIFCVTDKDQARRFMSRSEDKCKNC